MISQKLTEVFNSLPPEAQQTLVENHLASLVDLLPKEKSKKIMLAATRLQRKYNGAPKLDIRAKKKQIHKLLNELARDAKISFIKERSNREELLTEIVHSLMNWLNDIWSIVYEHNVNFALAHTCLLFTSDALVQLAETSTLGGCKCAVMNLPVNFNLKGKDRKILKRFNVLGPQNIDQILLWIWRDLFVTVLAKGSARDKKKVPEFLEEIESVLGVRSLERLLYGGRSTHEDEEESDEEDESDDFDRDLEDSDDFDLFGMNYPCDDEDDEDEDNEDTGCTCNLHANYWSASLNDARVALRDAVENRLFESFRVTPSIELSNILLDITNDTPETETRITNILSEVAGDSSENVAAALDIYANIHQPFKIISLLDTHSYLLRPRDADVLQVAVVTLHASGFQTRSLEIMEKELDDCIRAISATIRGCFAHIEDKIYKKELWDLLKLRSGSNDRKERVREWVDKVITPVNGPANLMAFAAMMVGFPMMPGTEDEDDVDLLSYVDLDHNDPDLDDLREEYRPNIKGMFDGWLRSGNILKGGQPVLMKTYNKAIELMPWLRASDVSAEMANKLRERPNKTHVLDALVALSAFAKAQRKKANAARTDSQRKAAAAAAKAAKLAGASSGASSSATPTNPGASSSAAPAPAATTTPTTNSPPASPPLDEPPAGSPFAAFFGASAPNSLPDANPPPMGAPPFFPFSMLVGDMEDVD